MIDIIIPAYNAHKTLERTLFSILSQSFEDINIFIIDDKSNNNYNEIVKKFDEYLNITEYNLLENKGPGYARNYGLKKSKGEYIIFLDADDIFFDHYSIENLYKCITKTKSDVVISSFAEEVGENKLEIRRNKKIWNHGKIYRRKYIEENKILFSETNTNEDLYFNFLLFVTKPKVQYIDDITYIWKYNENSITRKNNSEYIYIGLEDYNTNIYNVIIEAEKRYLNKANIVKVLFFGLLQMYYVYLMHLSNNDNDSAKAVLKQTKILEKKYYEYDEYLKKLDKNEIIYNEMEKNMNFNLETIYLPKQTFYEFMEEVKNYE